MYNMNAKIQGSRYVKHADNTVHGMLGVCSFSCLSLTVSERVSWLGLG